MTEAEELTKRGAALTRRMTRNQTAHDELARERADVWRKAIAAGASQHALARAAGLHHSQVAKAIERYGSNGS